MNVNVIVYLFTIGAAALALWSVSRFPSFGPQGVMGSIVLVIGAFVVLEATDGVVGSVARSQGPAAALLLVVLPTLTLAMWSCARLIRAFVSLVAPFRH
jgi:hypothetical protein